MKPLRESAIELIRLIRSKLLIKVFLLTLIVLWGLTGLTYTFILIVTPRLYQTELQRNLDTAIERTIKELSSVNLKRGKEIIKDLSNSYNIAIMLFDSNGKQIDYGEDILFVADGNTASVLERKSITQTYEVNFNDIQEIYTMTVLGKSEEINRFNLLLKRSLLWICIVILCISIIISYFYTKYITMPIKNISSYSRKLAELNFTSHYFNNRIDEIGNLAENLNELSEHLNNALDELRTANDSLKKEIEYEKKVEQQQMTLFSALSHELKTPITILKGQTQGMLYNVGGYKDRDKYLKRSFEVICMMEQLVKEILIASHIQSSMYKIKTENINLSEELYDIIKEYDEMILLKKVNIQIKLMDFSIIFADRNLIKKVFSNLISNAIHYSPKGESISISTKIIGDNPIICIKNTGTHIEENEKTSLFQPFTRGEKSRNRNTGGSGMGLYIAKLIIELHHFSIAMKNEQDGVCVEITLNKQSVK